MTIGKRNETCWRIATKRQRIAFVMVNDANGRQSRAMKITEAVRKYAAEQGIAEEEALKKGMEEKFREFTEKGSELYAKA